MKNLLLLPIFFLFGLSAALAQQTSRVDRKADISYTGKRFDSYGKSMDKKIQNKKKVKSREAHDGEYKYKAYPIGVDKDKRRGKSNFKGKRKKKGKGCDCPGH